MLKTKRLVSMAAPKMRTLYRRFLHALDDFAQTKMRNEVPEWQLRWAQTFAAAN